MSSTPTSRHIPPLRAFALRLCCLFVTAPLLPCGSALAQAKPQPIPPSAVAIENTNATFYPNADSTPEANPSRPSVTDPVHMPPTGYLQIEQGTDIANTAPGLNRQVSVSQASKVAVNSRLMFLLISQPYAYSVTPGQPGGFAQTANAPGDLDIAIQAIAHKSTGPLPTVGFQYLRRVRAGSAANLDAGSYDQGGMLMLGGDLPGGFHYDANIAVYQQDSGNIRRAQYLQTGYLSHPLFAHATGGKLSGLAELSHFTQPFGAVTAQIAPLPGGSMENTPIGTAGGHTLDLLLAVGYTLRPNLVLDSFFSHGFTYTATQWQGGFGLTYLFPHRLWADHHPKPIAVGPYIYR